MHEASLAFSILETIESQCRQNGYRKILEVRLKIGKASGVLADSLAFAFDVAKKGGMADEAVLIIDSIPLGGTCKTCGSTIETAEMFIFECPQCGHSSIEISQGYEMQIVDMEVD